VQKIEATVGQDDSFPGIFALFAEGNSFLQAMKLWVGRKGVGIHRFIVF
jgi:hypothetical protein